MLRLIYTSKITQGITSQDIENIINAARDYNSMVAISGLLMSNFEYFFQVLEGPDLLVRLLYEKIEKDGRHSNIRLLVKESVEQRLFPDWTMGYLMFPRENPPAINADWTKLTEEEWQKVLKRVVPASQPKKITAA